MLLNEGSWSYVPLLVFRYSDDRSVRNRCRERWCSAVSRTRAGTSCLGDGHAWLKEWHLSDILPRGREAEKERERERERETERERVRE